MALPPSLLSAVEQHRCFSGSFSGDARGLVCLNPAAPPEPMLVVRCDECLTWHAGALRRLLPPGMLTDDDLAEALTLHVRRRRGYRWSVGGYHHAGGGFWLSAACLGPGLFLVADQGSGPGALDRLLLGMQHQVVPCPDPGMLDGGRYRTQDLWVDFGGLATPLSSKRALLRSPRCSTRYKPGFREATLLEYLPMAGATLPSQSQGQPGPPQPGQTRPLPTLVPGAGPGGAPGGPPAGAPVPVAPHPTGPVAPVLDLDEEVEVTPLEPGDVCPDCGGEVKERPLLTGTYVGCLC